MGRYLALWEVDPSKIPVDVKERATAFTLLMDMVKQDINAGIAKEFGAFVGEFRGYGIFEGTEVEVGNMAPRYGPYVSFKLHALLSVNQIDETIKSLSR